MSGNKDELLKQQNEEIQKLKKELKAATKPSSMLSVLKNTVKRNVHDFFVREDKMKTMDSKIKKLEKELEAKEDELNKTSAELFAAVNLGSQTKADNGVSSVSDASDEASSTAHVNDELSTPVFPQTTEEAVKEYFGPINLMTLAKQLYPDVHGTPEQGQLEPLEPETTPTKTSTNISEEDMPIPTVNDSASGHSHTADKDTTFPSFNNKSTKKGNTRSKSDAECESRGIKNIPSVDSSYSADATASAVIQAQKETASDGNSAFQGFKKEKSSENAKPQAKTDENSKTTVSNQTTEVADKDTLTTRLSASLPDSEQGFRPTHEASTQDILPTDKFWPEIPRPTLKPETEKNIKNESSSEKPNTVDLRSPESVDVQVKTSTATVMDKSGKKRSKKDKRKQNKKRQEINVTPEVSNISENQSNTANAITGKNAENKVVSDSDQKPKGNGSLIQIKSKNAEMNSTPSEQKELISAERKTQSDLSSISTEVLDKHSSTDTNKVPFVSGSSPNTDSASDIELPDSFGIVIEQEPPSLDDLPDIDSSAGNIFDELFNSDSDNWDDSNI